MRKTADVERAQCRQHVIVELSRLKLLKYNLRWQRSLKREGTLATLDKFRKILQILLVVSVNVFKLFKVGMD